MGINVFEYLESKVASNNLSSNSVYIIEILSNMSIINTIHIYINDTEFSIRSLLLSTMK